MKRCEHLFPLKVDITFDWKKPHVRLLALHSMQSCERNSLTKPTSSAHGIWEDVVILQFYLTPSHPHTLLSSFSSSSMWFLFLVRVRILHFLFLFTIFLFRWLARLVEQCWGQDSSKNDVKSLSFIVFVFNLISIVIILLDEGCRTRLQSITTPLSKILFSRPHFIWCLTSLFHPNAETFTLKYTTWIQNYSFISKHFVTYVWEIYTASGICFL